MLMVRLPAYVRQDTLAKNVQVVITIHYVYTLPDNYRLFQSLSCHKLLKERAKIFVG